jgi:hypothetical protein
VASGLIIAVESLFFSIRFARISRLSGTLCSSARCRRRQNGLICLLAFESNFLPRCSSIFSLGNPLFALNDTFIFSAFQFIYFLIIIKCFGDIVCLIINAKIFIEKHSNMIKHQLLGESPIFLPYLQLYWLSKSMTITVMSS